MCPRLEIARVVAVPAHQRGDGASVPSSPAARVAPARLGTELAVPREQARERALLMQENVLSAILECHVLERDERFRLWPAVAPGSPDCSTRASAGRPAVSAAGTGASARGECRVTVLGDVAGQVLPNAEDDVRVVR